MRPRAHAEIVGRRACHWSEFTRGHPSRCGQQFVMRSHLHAKVSGNNNNNNNCPNYWVDIHTSEKIVGLLFKKQKKTFQHAPDASGHPESKLPTMTGTKTVVFQKFRQAGHAFTQHSKIRDRNVQQMSNTLRLSSNW